MQVKLHFYTFGMAQLCFHVLLRRGALSWTSQTAISSVSKSASKRLSRSPALRPSSSTTLLRMASTSEYPSGAPRKKPPKKKKKHANQFTVNTETTPKQAEKLARAFDELARKEGFSKSFSYFAKHEDFDKDEFNDNKIRADALSSNVDDNVDSIDFTDLDEDDHVDFNDGESSDSESMDERIAAAQQGLGLGGITGPDDLDRLAEDIRPRTLRQLGFRKELNPYLGDLTPRASKFKLVTDTMVCKACGSDFQNDEETRPGYLPPEKYDLQQKLSKIEEVRTLQAKAYSAEWSPEDEVEWLIQTGGKAGANPRVADIDIDKMADEMGIDIDKVSGQDPICQRCHGLQNNGSIDKSLRPGWSDDPLLAQSRFRKLLQPIARKEAVIIALVDLFDFAGSVLPELDSIAGKNPVIVAANKVDLLPRKMGPVRVEHWVRRELKYLGVRSLANVGGAVRLVSCKTGEGVYPMLAKARALADSRKCDIYVVGAANAGKSTFLNHILRERDPDSKPKKLRAGNLNKLKGAVTASPLPGTTLKFIKVELPGGKRLFDTPGLLVPGSLTQILTSEELNMVVPKKRVEPVSFRISSGKCILIGGLARVALIGDSRPFFFTVFVSNDIKIHPSDLSRADEIRRKHAGGLLVPPLGGPERIDEIGEFEHHEVDITGKGWKEVAADIALTGLGWVSVVGAGEAKVQISVPKGIAVSVRPPIMPFDIQDSTAKYTGGRAVRSTRHLKRGKGVKGVGRN